MTSSPGERAGGPSRRGLYDLPLTRKNEHPDDDAPAEARNGLRTLAVAVVALVAVTAAVERTRGVRRLAATTISAMATVRLHRLDTAVTVVMARLAGRLAALSPATPNHPAQ
jgi:hypothetical protein